MSKIVFNKRSAPKTANIMVRFEAEFDQELRQIAETEDISLVEVIRAFTKAGLDLYKKEGADVEA